MPRHPHEILLDELRTEYKSILDGSKQAIYVYLDNEHKICNSRYATMLGFTAARDWETLSDPMITVEEQSVNRLVSAFQNAIQNKVGSVFELTWKKQGGGSVKTNVIMVPIAFKGEMMALHFITTK